jgi:hypothetical protein
MNQLQKLKLLLGSPQESDVVLDFYLESAKNIICDIRNTDEIESKYLQTQLRIAIELYTRSRGANWTWGKWIKQVL